MIAIIDYEAGNLTSVARAVDHLGAECAVTRDLELIAAAERVIFPGVGAAGAAMNSLRRLELDQALKSAVDSGKPVLGICLGTQIIFDRSDEDLAGCLGLISGKVIRFAEDMKDEDGRTLKVPHMGWNQVQWIRPHPVFAGLPEDAEFYFVHSFHPLPENQDDVVGLTEYGRTFASVVAKDNLVATQFHPEKSGRPGLKILENFLAWNGEP